MRATAHTRAQLHLKLQKVKYKQPEVFPCIPFISSLKKFILVVAFLESSGIFFSLFLAFLQFYIREIYCRCLLLPVNESLSSAAVLFNVAHLACKSPFPSSFLFARFSRSLLSSPQQSVWELIKSVCVCECQWQVSLSCGSGWGVVLSSEPSSHPAYHCSSKEKWVLGCYSICVRLFFSVLRLTPLGRPGSSAACGDSSRQQHAAGPGPQSGLPLSGTSCVSQQPPLPSLRPPVRGALLCFCAPCLVVLMMPSALLCPKSILLVHSSAHSLGFKLNQLLHLFFWGGGGRLDAWPFLGNSSLICWMV